MHIFRVITYDQSLVKEGKRCFVSKDKAYQGIVFIYKVLLMMVKQRDRLTYTKNASFIM